MSKLQTMFEISVFRKTLVKQFVRIASFTKNTCIIWLYFLDTKYSSFYLNIRYPFPYANFIFVYNIILFIDLYDLQYVKQGKYVQVWF